jgi:hypothetical protein
MTDSVNTSENVEEFYGQANREKYQLAIGKIVWAWTEYHEMLADLHARVCGKNNKNKWSEALADWHAEKDDHKARQKLLRAAQRELPAGDHARTEIEWIVETTDAILRENRNIAAHMPLMSYTDENGNHSILPMTLLGNPRALQMAGRDVLTEYALLEARILHMKSYAIMIGLKLWGWHQAQDWPERPRL